MAKLTLIICAVAVVLCVVGLSQSAEGITCRTVVDSLLPCRTYITRGGNLPAQCCRGIRSLNSAANNSAARKMACQCIKVAARAYKANPRYAAPLPSRCNVNIGYPISYNVNCNK
ncbi:hypothetical protein ACJIZ3_022223 [Penstemon smallii]|uniref:Non-specific lipid-transfer protein n=1 Tax=Penstemon smallii TaxID=265156 RepID=A0ABD3SNL5_9LAMI